MILDSLANAPLYENLHPRLARAFAFLRETNLAALADGRVVIDGDKIFANVQTVAGKTPDTAPFETHRKYIDIQVPVSAPETMGWLPADDLRRATDAYDDSRDVAFWAGKTDNFIRVLPGQFAVFFPTDGHQPAIAAGQLKKIIVKILVEK
ncbi:beta-D-galactosidase [Planctomycetales bacterium]|nr:beta-D-galactosidase [Planctomycetales bacterium]GHS99983.1 beta-D-galactosidase [Planctomycetales bacterium]